MTYRHMLKIATHDSATGESGRGRLSWLVTPFVRTQGKTIREQYDAGGRSFDIRVRRRRGGSTWVCAHGLWESARTALDILREIDSFAEPCQVCLTYEGTSASAEDFRALALHLRGLLRNIVWGAACCKYGRRAGVSVDYVPVLEGQAGYEGGVQGFLPLDGRSWHTCLPVPWLWDRLCRRPHRFNGERFTFVDFL